MDDDNDGGLLDYLAGKTVGLRAEAGYFTGTLTAYNDDFVRLGNTKEIEVGMVLARSEALYNVPSITFNIAHTYIFYRGTSRKGFELRRVTQSFIWAFCNLPE